MKVGYERKAQLGMKRKSTISAGENMKTVQNPTIRIKLLNLLAEGAYPSKIAALLGKNHSVILRNIKKLESEGLVRKISHYPAFFVLTKKGKSTLSGPSDGRTDVSPYGMNCAHNLQPTQIHSAHKIKLSIPYSGPQPEQGAFAIRFFGRHKAQRQVLFRISKRITLIAFTKKLNIWVHKPKGTLTDEQLLNAKADAYMQAVLFAQNHSIELQGDITRVIQSHHVVEPEAINKAFKPLFDKYGESIKERIGSDFCKTSHPGKLEHEGVKRPDEVIIQGADVAKGMEYLVLQLKGDVSSMKEKLSGLEATVNYGFRESIQGTTELIVAVNKLAQRKE